MMVDLMIEEPLARTKDRGDATRTGAVTALLALLGYAGNAEAQRAEQTVVEFDQVAHLRPGQRTVAEVVVGIDQPIP